MGKFAPLLTGFDVFWTLKSGDAVTCRSQEGGLGRCWGLGYASSQAGKQGDYSGLSWKAQFHCKCMKCRTVSLGSSHIKSSPQPPPMVPALDGAVFWAVGANLCWQLHIGAVPAADASPVDVGVSWGRLRVSDLCWQ